VNTFLHHFILGAGGAAAFEALKLWDLHGKLGEERFLRLLRSFSLWIPLVLMLAASGFLTWAFYDGDAKAKTWNLVVTGIAIRTLVREVASAGFANSKRMLGGAKPGEPSVRDFFE
jgi:hypothetical protein